VSLYLEIATGEVSLESCKSEEEVAEMVVSLICRHRNDWVRLCSSDYGHWTTEWTVLERNSDNSPAQIGCEEFDGGTGIISTGITN
jgi:hypothetical protein